MHKSLILCGTACLALAAALHGQPSDPSDKEMIRQLTERLAESERRIQALEQKLGVSTPAAASDAGPASASSPVAATAETTAAPAPPAPGGDTKAIAANTQPPADPNADQMQGGHHMEIPGGGPTLNIRGFFDFNFGVGSIANPLVFPIASNGCMVCGNPETPPHTAFQAGEFDLFVTSNLSDHLSFLSEMVFGPDTTNEFEIDIERYQLTYRANDYLSISAGRFHTAIGYYNTAYHHGTWFSTAEGRPIMYLFEDSGGVLPVHTVGVSMTGLVPKTEPIGLHWVAEVGNGRSSNPNAEEPVQNFYSDRNYKAFNFAAYIRPEFVQGLQIGGSFYHDRLVPPGVLPVSQDIPSAYVVYITHTWEFLNEAVLLSNHLVGTPVTFRSPMAYTQVSRKFGIYRPYFRYQYVNDRVGDPVNVLQGLYYGPSIGLRIDYSEYAAFKLQYNRLWRDLPIPENGLNAQIAFTF
jgi:hypothetical protein